MQMHQGNSSASYARGAGTPDISARRKQGKKIMDASHAIDAPSRSSQYLRPPGIPETHPGHLNWLIAPQTIQLTRNTSSRAPRATRRPVSPGSDDWPGRSAIRVQCIGTGSMRIHSCFLVVFRVFYTTLFQNPDHQEILICQLFHRSSR